MTTKIILTLMADSIAVMGNGRIEVCGAKKAVFASPGTRTGAMLTGCKNISRLKKLGEHRVRALDWGMELTVDHAADTAGYVGIRMHDLRVGGDKNVIRCHVVEEIENPFSVTVMLRPVGTEDTVPVGWETDKETWDRLRTDELDICLPVESLLLLEGGAYAEQARL